MRDQLRPNLSLTIHSTLGRPQMLGLVLVGSLGPGPKNRQIDQTSQYTVQLERYLTQRGPQPTPDGGTRLAVSNLTAPSSARHQDKYKPWKTRSRTLIKSQRSRVMHQSKRALQLSIWCHLPRASVTCKHVPAGWTRTPSGRTIRLHVGGVSLYRTSAVLWDCSALL